MRDSADSYDPAYGRTRRAKGKRRRMVRSQWGKTGPGAVRAVVNSPFRVLMRTPERGADTIVWLATTTPGKDWTSGGYSADRKPATPSPFAEDADLAKLLWDKSATICGLEDV